MGSMLDRTVAHHRVHGHIIIHCAQYRDISSHDCLHFVFDFCSKSSMSPYILWIAAAIPGQWIDSSSSKKWCDENYPFTLYTYLYSGHFYLMWHTIEETDRPRNNLATSPIWPWDSNPWSSIYSYSCPTHSATWRNRNHTRRHANTRRTRKCHT